MSGRARYVFAAAVAAAAAIAVVVLSSGSDPKRTTTTSAAAPNWPAPADPLRLTVQAGLKPERREFLIHHVHAHLDVFADGKPVTVPAGIGINIRDPGVHRFTEPDGSATYGGIDLCRTPCISPLHTHDATGILHTESASAIPNTLGEFFVEWGVRMTDACVESYCRGKGLAVYVDGKPYTQDPRAIQLTDGKEIAVVLGSPPKDIPQSADFSQA